MIVGRVSELWWYPVKSFLGQQFDRLTIRPSGITGDRGLALADASSGRVLSAKRVHQLVSARTEGPEMVLPDGRRLSADDPDATTVLWSWLGRDVRAVRPSGGDTRPEIDGDEDA